MPVPIPENRIRNVLGGGERCLVCENDGMVNVPYEPHPGSDGAMGPCPSCEKGFRIEFGIGVNRNNQGKIVDDAWPNPEGGPWGKDGYWRGRDTSVLLGAPPIGQALEEIPEWVVRWRRARAAKDERPFPEQAPALDNPPSEPHDDRSAWVQPDEYLEDRPTPAQSFLDSLLSDL